MHYHIGFVDLKICSWRKKNQNQIEQKLNDICQTRMREKSSNSQLILMKDKQKNTRIFYVHFACFFVSHQYQLAIRRFNLVSVNCFCIQCDVAL